MCSYSIIAREKSVPWSLTQSPKAKLTMFAQIKLCC